MIHTGVDLSVPGLELGGGDTVLGGNGITRVARSYLVKLIAVCRQSRHLGGVARGRGGSSRRRYRGRGSRSGGGGGSDRSRRCLERGARARGRGRGRRRRRCRISSDGADDAVELAVIEVGAGDTWVQLLELIDRLSPAGGEALAGCAGIRSRGKGTVNSTGGQGPSRDHAGEKPGGKNLEACQLHPVGVAGTGEKRESKAGVLKQKRHSPR